MLSLLKIQVSPPPQGFTLNYQYLPKAHLRLRGQVEIHSFNGYFLNIYIYT